ncbi:MAG: hypothetical protein L6437_01115 [Kiritimatiellae bacterium]|nr:hypothetical protein [Verrucomicrobiota bacterium]MBU4365661.1 hypothetical protein [Verrucomicrobiota bacterium]MCG2658832.1 hypothetical protein [Kiritimatiellia bacterium]
MPFCVTNDLSFRHFGSYGVHRFLRAGILRVVILTQICIGFVGSVSGANEFKQSFFIGPLLGGGFDNTMRAGGELGVEIHRWRPHCMTISIQCIESDRWDNDRFDIIRDTIPGLGGVSVGYRYQFSVPLAPFLGLNGLNSFSLVGGDYIALNPEIGFTWPIDLRHSLTLLARYYCTTAGRAHDFITGGIFFNCNF